LNGDFSSKLDALLSNPAMMAQIKALADTMTVSGGAAGTPEPPPQEPAAPPEKAAAAASASVGNAANAEGTALPALFSPTPGIEKNLKNTRALLLALKPYLDAGRCEKIDKMLNMMRLAEMAGYFKNLL